MPDPSEYCTTLRKKLYDLREFVDANIVHSAERQRLSYESSSTFQKFKKDQQVLLSNSSKGKLSPCWTGSWTVKGMANSTTVDLKMGAAV